MKKCPQCGRIYSDMVTVCPSCNVSLGGKPVRKPVHDASASKETATEPRGAATPVQTQKQKKPNVVIMAIIFGLVAYCGAQFVSRGKPTPKNASEPITATAVTERPSSVRTDEITDPKEQYDLGNRYYYGENVQQDYAEAVKWYRLAAEQGYAAAQNSLGHCYDLGVGVQQDDTEAIKWYWMAADQGDSDGQYFIGCSYHWGKGIQQDYAEAIKWFRLSADQKNAKAQYMLGYCCYWGYGVQQDYTEAVQWFRLSANQGFAPAMQHLGSCYEDGTGVPQDAEEAEKWYQAYEAATGD